MSIVIEDASTGSAQVWRINPDEVDERRQQAWDEQQRLHPPLSQGRAAMLERLEDRARKLLLFARDTEERARETRKDAARFKSTLTERERHSSPRPYVPDPGDLDRLAALERDAVRLTQEATTLSQRAAAARQVAAACSAYLLPHRQGGPDDSRFSIRRGA